MDAKRSGATSTERERHGKKEQGAGRKQLYQSLPCDDLDFLKKAGTK